jgi:ABC-type antimicrobial peptide transport system permease subunit
MGGLDRWPEYQVYVPFDHATGATVTLVAHTRTAPLSQVVAVKNTVSFLDPDLPVFNVYSLEQVQQQFEWLPRFWTQMFSIFALFGLVITTVGLYGLISFSSAQRRREYGIRLALGAVPSTIVMLPVRQGLRLAAIGLAFGLVLAFMVARLMASVLFGVDPLDPLVYGGVAAVIILTGVVASLVPAMRILAFDPNTVLRDE